MSFSVRSLNLRSLDSRPRVHGCLRLVCDHVLAILSALVARAYNDYTATRMNRL